MRNRKGKWLKKPHIGGERFPPCRTPEAAADQNQATHESINYHVMR